MNNRRVMSDTNLKYGEIEGRSASKFLPSFLINDISDKNNKSEGNEELDLLIEDNDSASSDSQCIENLDIKELQSHQKRMEEMRNEELRRGLQQMNINKPRVNSSAAIVKNNLLSNDIQNMSINSDNSFHEYPKVNMYNSTNRISNYPTYNIPFSNLSSSGSLGGRTNFYNNSNFPNYNNLMIQNKLNPGMTNMAMPGMYQNPNAYSSYVNTMNPHTLNNMNYGNYLNNMNTINKVGTFNSMNQMGFINGYNNFDLMNNNKFQNMYGSHSTTNTNSNKKKNKNKKKKKQSSNKVVTTSETTEESQIPIPQPLKQVKKHLSDGNLKEFTLPKKGKTSLFKNRDSKSKLETYKSVDDEFKAVLEENGKEIHKYIVSSKGSRSMQKYLNKISPENLTFLLECLSDNFKDIMTDVYGNYFCQKLCQICSCEQRIFIFKHIAKDFISIACHQCGTHALQSLLELINMPEEELLIVKSIENDILHLDPNGTHVLQKIIMCVDENNREVINLAILEHFKKIVIDSNGICVIKKFINSNKNGNYKKEVYEEVCTNCLELVQNPFGNYAIQHIFEEWGIEYCSKVADIIISNSISLSMQKFSSNVVEKCLELVDYSRKIAFFDELFIPSKIGSLLKNKYGNFVLLKAINLMDFNKKVEIKSILLSKVFINSSKEKQKFNYIIKMLENK